MIIGILGFAHTGKDSIANILMGHGFQGLAFADRVKRVCMDIFEFTIDQLWGTLEQKEAPDVRYPRDHVWNCSESAATSEREPYCLCCATIKNDPDRNPCYLTPRYAMKMVSTEGARAAWSGIWVKRALEDAQRVEQGCLYSRVKGVLDCTTGDPNALLLDCRFRNEVEGILKAGGVVYRVKRTGYEQPMFDHPSETEQLQIPDSRLNGVIYNDGTLEDLKDKVLLELGLI